MTHSTAMSGRAALLGATSLAAALCAAGAAAGQDQPAVAKGPIERIVVTAQRVEQSAQSVPISLNVLTPDELLRAGVSDSLDLQFVVPGLVITNDGNDQQLYIRGIGSPVLGLGSENSVATYIDGVYVARQSQVLQEFNDIARVEVLKGPQATLYGRNATGGAINIVSNAPSDAFEAFGDVQIGDYEALRLRGTVNIPLGEKAAARLSGLYSEHEGWDENLLSGQRPWSEERTGLRGALSFAPSDNIDVILRADYAKSDGTEGNFKSVNPSSLIYTFFGGTFVDDPRAYFNDVDIENPIEQYGLSADVSFDLGGVTLRSITGHRDFDIGPTFLDLDGSEVNFIADQGSDAQSQTFSQEFLLEHGAEGELRWLLGAMYFTEDGERNFRRTLFGGPFPGAGSFARSDVEAWAAFGQATLPLTRRLSLTGGLRYSYEDRQYFENLTNVTGSENWDQLSPRIALEYQASDNVFLYGAVTNGFKSGGFNSANATDPFNPEKVWSYEAGLRSDLANGRAQFNATAFYYDYTDLQVSQLQPNLLFAIDNAAAASVLGLELEGALAPVDNLVLSANATFLNAEYDQFLSPDPFNPGPGVVDQKGNPLTRAPDFSAFASALYTIPLGPSGAIDLYADYYYQSRMQFTEFDDNRRSAPSYSLVNARITYRAPGDHWNVSLFGRNIFDELVVTFANADASTNTFIERYAPPATYGVEAGFKF